ncbi:hypothetical protein P3X46_014894 [Hevea brasiliensis]|uniref:Aluminum-activated malate transporter n=1 Tax=Hevea brasiliensis TaxID=3981 RepID=A0ABQ9LW42_HEVBR|nr:hypothetical protein P3X46_014894 [Hevea brasiliensis]
MEKESNKLEWRINKPDGTSEILVPESGPLVPRVWLGLKGLVGGIILKIWKFWEKAWDIGVAEPKKVIHGLKVGVALSFVSLFHYIRPLYEGAGGNAMWAVMTVVVVFEYTVGSTPCKCINRATATFLAGSLGLGVHWAAIQTGEKLEPIILGISVFLFASAATFLRFIPSVKARFDCGAMIFILTYSLIQTWEPSHGRFNFRHPWKMYLRVGVSLRSCAYCIQTLNGCLNSEIQAPEYLKKHLSNPCTKLIFSASNVLNELATTVKTMIKPSNKDSSTGFEDMQYAAQELKNALKSLPSYYLRPQHRHWMVLPLVTLIFLLIETATKVEDIVDAINELARLAEFKPVIRVNQNEPSNKLHSNNRPSNNE